MHLKIKSFPRSCTAMEPLLSKKRSINVGNPPYCLVCWPTLELPFLPHPLIIFKTSQQKYFMKLNLESPVVTWAVIGTVVTTALSVGAVAFQVTENHDANLRQWSRINANEKAVDTYANKIADMEELTPTYEQSTRELRDAVLTLTLVVDNAEKRAVKEDYRREKEADERQRMNDKITNIQVQVGQIQEKLAK